jgi:hypothetical protein
MTQALEGLPRVLYLGGLGRSGSTLAARLLGQLPGAFPAGEISQIWRRGIVERERCGCGEQFPACPFWRKVGEVGFGGWDSVDVARLDKLRLSVDRSRFIPQLTVAALRRPAFSQTLAEYVNYYLRIYAAIAEVSGCQVVVDSSKNASLAFCLRHIPQLDLRVVHVVRDSRAVAYSWTKRVRQPAAAPGKYMMRYSPAASAVLWNTQNAAMRLLARGNVPTLRVRYEDLAAAPTASLRRIAAFSGLPANGGQLGFLGDDGTSRWADLGVAHTASGNPMRFTAGRIEIRTDESWRAHFPPFNRALVSILTLPGLARYHYL